MVSGKSPAKNLGSSNVVVWPGLRLRLTRSRSLFTCLWGERRLVLGWGARGIPSHASYAPQPNPNLLSLLSLQIYITSNRVRVWDWGVRKQWEVEENYWLTRMLPLPGQPFSFSLVMNCVTSSIKRNDFGMTWLQNDVIRPLNSGLWALKKKEERTSLRPFFDTSKRLSYFYLSTMNIFLEFQGTSLMLLLDTGVRTKTEVCQVKM